MQHYNNTVFSRKHKTPLIACRKKHFIGTLTTQGGADMADLRESVLRLARLVDQAMAARPDVSMNQIALYAGVSNGYLSRIRRGMLTSPPSPDILKRLAPHLRVSYEELLQAAGYIIGPQDMPEEMGVFLRAQRELKDEDFRELVNYALYQLHKAKQRKKQESEDDR